MRVTVLPQASILTKAQRAAVSMMAKGCIVALVLPLSCFLFFTSQPYSCLCNCNDIVFIFREERSIVTGILPTPKTPLSSLPVGSNECFTVNILSCLWYPIPTVSLMNLLGGLHLGDLDTASTGHLKSFRSAAHLT